MIYPENFHGEVLSLRTENWIQ